MRAAPGGAGIAQAAARANSPSPASGRCGDRPLPRPGPGRRSFDHLADRKAVHVLSAFAGDAALILARRELAGVPDEIAAVPKPMAEPGLSGVLFTADALHCHEARFAQAAATGNTLLVRVKENQPSLHAALVGLCAGQHPFEHHEAVRAGNGGGDMGAGVSGADKRRGAMCAEGSKNLPVHGTT